MRPKKDPQEPKPKKTNVKPSTKKKDPPTIPKTESPVFDEVATQSPPNLPIDLPDDDGDDAFWDFYDKPFNKPK